LTCWYVVHTQAHAESKAAENLFRQGYEVYLPVGRRWRFHARRREVVLRPLFPRYLFVGFDAQSARWRTIFSTIGVAFLICHGDVPARVPKGVVECIRDAERAGEFDEAGMVARLKPGDPVRIARGPFADLTGELQSLVAGDRVRVLLRILGRQVPTTVGLAEVASA
jgi:transcriptional antiterminator RfaH